MKKHLGLYIDVTLLQKIQYIGKFYGCSGSGQIIYLIRTAIADFEQEHSTISAEDLKRTQNELIHKPIS